MKKLFSLILCVAMVITLAAGMAASAEETYDLQLWCFADTHAQYFEYISEQYHNEHPNVTITVQCMDSTAERDMLMVAIAADGEGAPDMADIEQGTWPSFMNEESMCFEPIEGLLERDGLSDAMVKARLELYAYDGHYYGLEHALCPVTMAYRPDLFEAAGVEVPTTWEEYKAAAYALKENGVYITSITDMHTTIQDSFTNAIVRASGNDVVTADGKFQFTDGYATIISDIRTMVDDGCIFTYEADADKYFEISENHVATEFLADWAAGWLRDNVPEQEGMWRMTYLPKFDENSSRASVNGGTGLTMLKYGSDERKEVVWDFMKYALLDAEHCVTKYEMVSLYPPVYEAMEACNTPVAYYGDQNLGELWQELAPETPVQYQAAFRAQFDEVQKQYCYDFAEGDMTAEEFAEAIRADMAEYM